MKRKHQETLELPKILEQLAAHTSFSAGAEKARNLTPSPIFEEIQQQLETTTEARKLLEAHPQTTVGGARDVRPQLDAARRGMVLTPSNLLDIQGTLIAARKIRQTLTRLERQFPHLADIASRITPCPDLIERISRCLDERGEVKDSASSELARIRRDVSVTHQRLMDKLENIVHSSQNARLLQESLITQREGRYVIPVKAKHKDDIQGIVHDRSASGATLFIEPLAVVEMGNAWRELQIEEEQEIKRILADLSSRVADRGAEIEHTVDAMADLDLAFAKAQYAEDLEATAPKLVPLRETEAEPPFLPGSTIRLLQARHPLLHPDTVVPIDVELEDETHILVITGPNTGGKTVTLKTVGLLTLMAQSGLHIPVAPGSALSPFEAVYADIGDEQSIEQSLSTFSSHLTNILSFIDQADQRSLVLLDELGAGTDPTEGSALARALLDTFRQQGATTFVATHYQELKAYAQLTPGVRNASVEFDTRTLRPTYHLTIGLPGRSNAFAIAQRLGMDEQIVQAADEMISREDRRTEDMLSDIHRLRIQIARERDKAHAARREAEQLQEEVQQRLDQIDEERREILEQAHEEAGAELEMLREEIRALRQRYQAAAKPQTEVRSLQEEVEELEEIVEERRPQPKPKPVSPTPAPARARPIKAGDQVWVAPLRKEGQVLTMEEEEAQVQVGPARVQVPLSQLELRGAPPEPQGVGDGATYEVPAVEPRIDLRGDTVQDALERLDRHLDAASLANLSSVLIVHGKGTGALRRAVRDYLRECPVVQSFRPGKPAEGGSGVTIAEMMSG